MLPRIDSGYVKAVAAHCGADPDVVAQILQHSYRRRSLYHGVSMSSVMDDVRDDGLYPRKVEGDGPKETVWTFGRCLFSRDGISPDATEYSTLFHHAHNKDGISIVVSNPDEMGYYDIHPMELTPSDARIGQGDGIFVVREYLDCDYYALLHVGLPETKSVGDPVWSRRVGMAGEKMMMELLADFLRSGVSIDGYRKEVEIDTVH